MVFSLLTKRLVKWIFKKRRTQKTDANSEQTGHISMMVYLANIAYDYKLLSISTKNLHHRIGLGSECAYGKYLPFVKYQNKCQNKFLFMQLIEFSGIRMNYSITHQSHQQNNRIKLIDSLQKIALKIFTVFQMKLS